MIYQIVLSLILLVFSPIVCSKTYSTNDHYLIDRGINWSLPIETLVFITLLSFIPACLLMMTCFTRIIIVFSLLRNALGTPYAPPNQIILGLGIFLTCFIMSPIFEKIYNESIIPFNENQITAEVAIKKSVEPIKKFMLNQIKENDLILFSKLSHRSLYTSKDSTSMFVVIPAFITSELKAAFKIGFIIFVPFLIIDLVIASVLMALGMMMVPPSTISLPFKLMFFILADGWNLLITSLVHSFNF